MTAPQDYPILPFASGAEFESWIVSNPDQSGVWVKIAKKASGISSVTYDEALDVALCYGWIDGAKHGLDDMYFLQKFTPRRSKSTWSKRNVAKVAELIAAGRMKPAGLAEVDAAKADGRWDAAYDSQKDMTVPEDFLQAVAANPSAQESYKALNKANIFAIAYRLRTAKKPETRRRRFDMLLAMLARGEKLH
jgi:uncharacterized protein YdeI (YjbR/CyaY-like superfamily)